MDGGSVENKVTQEQFLPVLWEVFKDARVQGVEWKWIEWIRDPVVHKLKISKLAFNDLLEQAVADSAQGLIPWHIDIDQDSTPRRRAQTARSVPVNILGTRCYIMAMRPIQPDKGKEEKMFRSLEAARVHETTTEHKVQCDEKGCHCPTCDWQYVPLDLSRTSFVSERN